MLLNPEQLAELGIHYLDEFDGCRDSGHPQTRLAHLTSAALRVREKMLMAPLANFYQTVDLIRVPYPTKYGLLNACKVPTPFMHILNRLFVVQFQTPVGLKTLLFSPSDIEGNRETPFFRRLSQRMGPFEGVATQVIAPVISNVEDALAKIGIKPAQVDFISYDHLHTQDLRKWLGDGRKPGYFPNAKLLVMKQEWESTQSLLPPQKDWYCPNGIAGIPSERVVLLEKSCLLGESVALIATPGHTEGNHSLVVHTPNGLLVSSENGVSADNWAPIYSRIPGVADYAETTGMEVILNGNTLERGLDQYLSMIVEKTIAGPCPKNPDFYNVVPSSELTRYRLFPGLQPTFTFGAIKFGDPFVN
ncbi:MAG TPA: hypothetical protein VFM46_17790 [Pseudomonadales bacterium]|nr:hypothetical protein [Pseudomonadales bacterium]